jgi:threonine/homoserine/homoserine lactone efflux protein
VVVEALNIKTALFFLAFLPQFIDPTQSVTNQLIVMGTTCVALNALMDVLVVLAAHRFMGSGASVQTRSRWMQRTSGFTMLGLGAWLALARRV